MAWKVEGSCFIQAGGKAVVEIFGIFYSFPLAMTIEQEGNEVVFFLLLFSPTSHTTARAVPPKSILELQVHSIYRIFQFILFDYEHGHIDRQIFDISLHVQVVIAQNYRPSYSIIRGAQDFGQRIMTFVILARLDFQGNDFIIRLQYKVNFSLLLAVEVVQIPSMSVKFLRDSIFKYATIVHVHLPLQNLQLDPS